ncbi:MAG: calcium-translocating P-type ATPase, PMCA-type [Clostridia bacterium]|nr:calcium-translocating P-type ATPase, PMCA-type [Clostridia bacterium]
MNAYTSSAKAVADGLSSDLSSGLTPAGVSASRNARGANALKKRKKKSLVKRLIAALSEPTLVILEFAWIITVGVNLGKYIKSGDGDALECVGIAAAILLSAFLTVFMEGRSEKAFEALGAVYEHISVKAVRAGKTVILDREDVVVGDVIILGTGDKVVADGRLIASRDMTVDESMLTGESVPVKKNADVLLDENTPLAERVNCVYSGTFVSSGTGSMIVTAVGEAAVLGKIASDLGAQASVSAPLNQKLNRLGKTITLIGGIAAGLVFALSVLRLVFTGDVNFFSVQDVFIEAIVLIVAAVPEGLPTTAAISLSLNVLKLARSNALIRKLVAAETVGCVSVICSDKTGTLTKNEMTVVALVAKNKRAEDFILKNSALNSTAIIKRENGKDVCFGSATECALIKHARKNGCDYQKMRKDALIGEVVPFDSSIKYMLTEDRREGVTYIKGAPEAVLKFCAHDEKIAEILKKASTFQSESKRVVAFSHGREGKFELDGIAAISDPVRPDVKASIESCREAGIEVKMLTGDNAATAEAIARELGLVTSADEVATAAEIDAMSEEKLIRALPSIRVIARSTPATKLKVVEALKKSGEVVAVTGDGVNDAPAIKHADIGIAMGSGSEIAKEAGDIVLLDDSFSTIVKAISFGRNIYRNFQRFITFQLSVNLTAMTVVVASLALGLANPFNAVQLLWIDIIMDGPPALTLGMETGGDSLMRARPVARTDSIITFGMLVKIILQAAFMGGIVVAEYLYDFLGAGPLGVKTAIFSLFVIFQLFNAFNCRKTGAESVFSSFGNNKLMVFVFGATFLFQIFITQLSGGFFDTVALPFGVWVKIVLTAFLTIAFSETYKLLYRFYKKGQNNLPLRVKKYN